MAAPLPLFDGTVAAPGLTFSNDTNTGFYRAGADDVRVASGGVEQQRWTATGTSPKLAAGTVSAPSASFHDDAGTGFYLEGAGSVGLATEGVVAARVNTTSALLRRQTVVDPSGLFSFPIVTDDGFFAVGKAGAPGLAATAGTAATGAVPKDAARLTNGNLKLEGAYPNAAVAVTNTLTPSNVPKAWALVATDGAGGVTVKEGFNVESVTVNTTAVIIEFATAFADANYAALATGHVPSGGVTASQWHDSAGSRSTTTAQLTCLDVGGGNLNPSTNAVGLNLVVFGKQ